LHWFLAVSAVDEFLGEIFDVNTLVGGLRHATEKLCHFFRTISESADQSPLKI
jgi:hypothetical protein